MSLQTECLLGHARIAWRLPGFCGWQAEPVAAKLLSLNTAALPPVFRFFGAGRGSMTPASPRREASLFTYPRSWTGGFFFTVLLTLRSRGLADLSPGRRCFVTTGWPGQTKCRKQFGRYPRLPGRPGDSETHHVVVAP